MSSITGHQLVAPSPISLPGDEVPRQLTIAEIKEIVCRFADASARAKRAGFDAVEIHAAHGYLINQFLSAGSNKRQDEYGGDLGNRARILLDTISAIKGVVGDSYPLWCRINGREYGIEDGITTEEAQEIARMCQAAGTVAIHVSSYSYGTNSRHLPPSALPPGALIRFAEAVKQAVSIPVIACGRITPSIGEKAVDEGRADLIAVGRGLIADPQFAKKAVEGKLEDIRPCIVCGTCQSDMRSEKSNLYCRVNPAVGKERESIFSKAKKMKTVVVIGGGPAGMEAAIIAAQRRHRVTLFEKEQTVGGQLLIAAVPPYKGEFEEITKYLSTQLEKAKVSIKLGVEATMADIESINPDVVFLATGGVPFIPEIQGTETGNVVIAEEVLAGRVEVGERVIVIGGELVGCETAEFLAEAGKKVTITRRGQAMASTLAPNVREPLLGRLTNKGVTMLTSIHYEEVTVRGLVITSKEGQKHTIHCDTIVLAAGSKPNTKLLTALKDRGLEVYQIGDCLKPRSLLEALADGFHTARNL